MRNLTTIALAALCAAALTGCAVAPLVPPPLFVSPAITYAPGAYATTPALTVRGPYGIPEAVQAFPVNPYYTPAYGPYYYGPDEDFEWHPHWNVQWHSDEHHGDDRHRH